MFVTHIADAVPYMPVLLQLSQDRADEVLKRVCLTGIQVYRRTLLHLFDTVVGDHGDGDDDYTKYVCVCVCVYPISF